MVGAAERGRTRTAALAVVFVGLGALGAVVVGRWPSGQATLDCPAHQVSLDERGVARCAQGAPVPAAQRLTLGAKLDLNRATEAELALVSGIGPALARALVEARGASGFRSWDDVDRVRGVGQAKLEALQKVAEIGPASSR